MSIYKKPKSYDVKTFLNKRYNKKTTFGYFPKRSFVSLTLGRKSINAALYSVVCILFLVFTFSFMTDGISGDKLFSTAAYFTLPFYTENPNLSGNDLFLFPDIVSSLIRYKPPALKEAIRPALPAPDIKTLDDSSNGIEIKNETDYIIDTEEMLASPPVVSAENPKVLIVHTHGSESYTPSDSYPYTQTGNYRTQDIRYNMIRVGEEIARELMENGVTVIHDRTINDYPSYNASYNKTGALIEKHIADDKNIAFVFDIHRDALGDSDNIVRLATDIGGTATAQVMMVCGTDTNLDNPLWQQNLSLGLYIQRQMEEKYPGFMRPLNLRKERFNMHLSTGSLLFEIGTNGNTLDEALAASKILGRELAEVIKELSR